MGHDDSSLTGTAPDLLRGTVDILILRTLAGGPLHGYAIAQRLRVVSSDVLQVGESSLYPALQRLLAQGWTKAEWGLSENNRRARYYTITTKGRRHLATEGVKFERLLGAMTRVMQQG
jgi:transcriptional regulator